MRLPRTELLSTHFCHFSFFQKIKFYFFVEILKFLIVLSHANDVSRSTSEKHKYSVDLPKKYAASMQFTIFWHMTAS